MDLTLLNRKIGVHEWVGRYELDPLVPENGPAFHFVIDLYRETEAPGQCFAKVFRREFLRVRPTFAAGGGEGPGEDCDEVVLVEDGTRDWSPRFDSAETALQSVLEQLADIFGSGPADRRAPLAPLNLVKLGSMQAITSWITANRTVERVVLVALVVAVWGLVMTLHNWPYGQGKISSVAWHYLVFGFCGWQAYGEVRDRLKPSWRRFALPVAVAGTLVVFHVPLITMTQALLRRLDWVQ